jgi:hypothetical protein
MEGGIAITSADEKFRVRKDSWVNNAKTVWPSSSSSSSPSFRFPFFLPFPLTPFSFSASYHANPRWTMR